ncbi:MAG: hypothetical protein ACRBCI_02700 [Cellvibrionaceae bacterium]
MSAVKIVLVEWMGYPLYRNKQIGAHTIKCGLGRLLENIQKLDAGVDFDCRVIVNEHNNKQTLTSLIGKQKLLRKFFLNNSKTNSIEKFDHVFQKYPFIEKVTYRQNIGQDIGAYDFIYRQLMEENYTGDILFMNSSVRGPHENGWLKKYQDLFNRHENTGLAGITLNSYYSTRKKSFDPHVQSFFLYSNMQILKDVFPDGIYNGQTGEEKRDLIINGEIGISRKVLDKGYGISCSAFPEFCYKKDDEWTIPFGDMRFNDQYKDLTNLI